jgi:acetyl esterase/lipase
VGFSDGRFFETPPNARRKDLDGQRRRLRLPAGRLAAVVAGILSITALAGSSQALATISSPYGPVYERLSYGPRLRQLVDVFVSPTPNATTVILVHGGGWREYFALSQYAPESMALQQQGFTVFDINYRQDSETTAAFPLEPSDVMTATQWAIANAASFNANPGNVILLGGSAGGNLVALAAEQLDATAPGTVRAVVSLSGPMNFMSLLSLIERGMVTNEDFIFSVNQALGRDPGSTIFKSRSEVEAYPATWSPALHVPARNCPAWLLFNSEAELIPLSQAQEMNADLLKAGCRSTLDVLPGSGHSFAYFRQVDRTIFSFIKAQ